MKQKYMVWLDLETTGLDEKRDFILELGVVITRIVPPFEEIGRLGFVVRPPCSDHPKGWRQLTSDFVIKMHEKSGLAAEVDEAWRHLSTAEANMIEWIDKTIGKKSEVMLCGAGITHFDNYWLKDQMPKLWARVEYLIHDTSVISRAFELAGTVDPVEPQRIAKRTGLTEHRAVDDCLIAIEIWREQARLFNPQYDQQAKENTAS